MTKEEILEGRRHIFGNKHMDLFSDTILNMMGEYAKQQAIAFGIWKENNSCRSGEGEWQVRFDNWVKGHTIDQLYNLFIEQQNKP